MIHDCVAFLTLHFQHCPLYFSILKVLTGVGSGGYAGDLTPQLFIWGY